MSLGLVSFLARTILIGLLAEGLILIFRKRSAELRHVIAVAGVASVLLLGLTTVIAGDSSIARLSTPIGLSSPVSVSPVASSGEVRFSAAMPSAATVSSQERRVPIPAASPRDLLRDVWLLGVAVCLVRLAFSFVLLALRMRRTQPIEGLGREVVLDPKSEIPVTAWWGRSLILLPPTWSQWPEDALNSVLRHEEAHIRRRDWWVHLAASVACAVVWPNPMVWRLRFLCKELSEQVADNHVLAGGVPASRYARDLLQIAVSTARGSGELALPMAVKSDVSRRIEMVLNQKQNRGAATLAAIVAVSGVFASLTAGVSCWTMAWKTVPPAGAARGSDPGAIPLYFVREKWYVVDFKPQVWTKGVQPVGHLASPPIYDVLDSVAVRKLIAACNGELVGSRTLQIMGDENQNFKTVTTKSAAITLPHEESLRIKTRSTPTVKLDVRYQSTPKQQLVQSVELPCKRLFEGKSLVVLGEVENSKQVLVVQDFAMNRDARAVRRRSELLQRSIKFPEESGGDPTAKDPRKLENRLDLPRPLPGSRAPNSSDTQYLISTKWYVLDYRSDVPISGKLAGRQDDLSVIPGIGDIELAAFIKSRNGKLLNSPVIRTLSGLAATMNTSMSKGVEDSLDTQETVLITSERESQSKAVQIDIDMRAEFYYAARGKKPQDLFVKSARLSMLPEELDREALCTLSPVVDSKQVLVVHKFKMIRM